MQISKKWSILLIKTGLLCFLAVKVILESKNKLFSIKLNYNFAILYKCTNINNQKLHNV